MTRAASAHVERAAAPPPAERIVALDWAGTEQELNASGCAVARALLTAPECAALKTLYSDERQFRGTVVMARHGFGRGEYRYFCYPLPAEVAALRAELYQRLVGIANRWNELLGMPQRLPLQHAAFVARCHAAGQKRPTPLLLRYGAGDYNCLHQDLYGEHRFPLQVTVLLSMPEAEFTGGEFVLVEQRPRMQSRAEVVRLRRGDAVIFPVHHRPVQGTRGFYRVKVKHGVSRVHSGERLTLGIIFHDAR